MRTFIYSISYIYYDEWAHMREMEHIYSHKVYIIFMIEYRTF